MERHEVDHWRRSEAVLVDIGTATKIQRRNWDWFLSSTMAPLTETAATVVAGADHVGVRMVLGPVPADTLGTSRKHHMMKVGSRSWRRRWEHHQGTKRPSGWNDAAARVVEGTKKVVSLAGSLSTFWRHLLCECAHIPPVGDEVQAARAARTLDDRSLWHVALLARRTSARKALRAKARLAQWEEAQRRFISNMFDSRLQSLCNPEKVACLGANDVHLPCQHELSPAWLGEPPSLLAL